MADERTFELLDDYLTNRMGEGNRAAFEQQIKADPDLQHELALQKRLIQGIKDARISELKAMLNNVPVPPAPGAGNTMAFKIGIAAVATLIVAAVAYWSLKEDHTTQVVEQQIQSEQIVPPDEAVETPVQPEPKVEEQAVSPAQERRTADRQQDKNQTSAGTEHSRPSLAKKPSPLSAPAAKNAAPADKEESDKAPDSQVDLAPVSPALTVETAKNNKRYTFHYQFRDGKLLLFGPFEKDRYEVVEFVRDEDRRSFLLYEDRYYSLDQTDDQVRPLVEVTDQALLQKLNEYRASK